MTETTGSSDASGTQQERRPPMMPGEALEKIRNGEVVRSRTIENLVVRGELAGDVEFEDCELVRAQIHKGSIGGTVRFRGCRLRNLRVHQHVEIGGDLDFRNCEMKRLAVQDASIDGSLQLENCQLRGGPRIRDVHVGGTKWWGTRVDGWLEMHGFVCRGTADLRSISCEQGIVFERCRFAGPVLFRGTSLGKKLDLCDSAFEDLIDLSKVKLCDFAYLDDIERGDGVTFAFANALADKMHLPFDRVEGRLHSEKEGDFETAAGEYALLKTNYQNLHRFDDEDRAFYAFRVAARKAKAKAGGPLSAFVEWLFLDLGCGYGADPWKAVRTAVVSMLLFALLFFLGADLFTDGGKVDVFNDGVATSWGEKAVYALAKSVSIFTAGLAGDQLLSARGWVVVPLAVEALLGTFLWGLFIVAFGRKVIR